MSQFDDFVPFFLSSPVGNLFCNYYPPHPGYESVRSLVHLPAFAEEMNKSRRMVSLQAHAFARQGIGVLVVDLPGTGDSEGAFAKARLNIWVECLVIAEQWLRDQGSKYVGFWALRLGGCLALLATQHASSTYESLIWWQPVTSGRTYMTQFLRLRVASALFSKNNELPETTNTLKSRLEDGEVIEVAGYALDPDLYHAINQFKAADFHPALFKRILLFEISVNPENGSLPAVKKLQETWTKKGCSCSSLVVKGDGFWATQEISTCPALIEQTSRLVVLGDQD